MKDGYIQKSAQPDEQSLLKINAFSRSELLADDVYTFSVVLCDNEIDRDGERFTTQSLYGLAPLFVGKTGIFDHSQKSGDQTARIYECFVEESDKKQNSLGEKYACLKASAYMPKLNKNNDLIAEIEAGIKKEVSVGCSVAKCICSICGVDVQKQPCEHITGKQYGEKICHIELCEPTDAYEWSFVAVPAQPLAGVTKNFAAAQSDEIQKLHSYINILEKQAQYGKKYKQSITDDIIKLVSFTVPNADLAVINTAAEHLDVDELCELKGLFEEITAQYGEKSQFLSCEQYEEKNTNQNSFII